MHVISKKMLRDFWAIHPDSEIPLRAWHREAEHSDWGKFADVRRSYPHADQVGHLTVFNVGGNKYRLIAAIHYNRQKVHVRHVLTHENYAKGTWKDG